MSTTLAMFCVAIVVASLLGGLLPLASVLTHTRLQIYLSFAAGTMLGAAFFHMLPEAIEVDPEGSLRWVVLGLLTMFFLERFFAFHHHESPAELSEYGPEGAHDPAHHHHHDHASLPVLIGPSGQSSSNAKGTTLIWGVAAIGLAAHTLIGGIALASASADRGAAVIGPAAWGVFIATLAHKPADALTIVSLMLRAGVPKLVTHLVNLVFSLLIPMGVALFFAGLSLAGQEASESITAAALAFSAGTFLCIALSDLLPELHFHAHDRVMLSIALLAGLALMFVAASWEY